MGAFPRQSRASHSFGGAVAIGFVVRTTGIVVALLFDLFFIRTRGLEFFGQLAVILALLQSLSFILPLGLNHYVVKVFAAGISQKTYIEASSMAILALIATSVFGAAFGSVALVVASWSDLFAIETTGFMIVSCVLYCLFEVSRQFLRGIGYPNYCEALLLIAMPLVFILVAQLSGITSIRDTLVVLTLTLVGLIIISLVSFFRVLKTRCRAENYLDGHRFSVHMGQVAKPFIKALKEESLPMTFSGLFGSIQQRADVLLLGFLLPPTAIGVYQVLSRLSLIVLFGLRTVQSIVAPRVAGLFSEKQLDELLAMFKKTSFVILMVGVAGLFGILLFKNLFDGLFGISGEYSVSLLIVLCCARLSLALAGGAPIYLLMIGMQKSSAVAAIIAALILLAVTLVSVPMTGAIGAALGLLGCNCFYALKTRSTFLKSIQNERLLM